MDVINNLKKFFDSEYKSTELFVKRHSKDTDIVYFAVESSINMCLGAAQFAQYFEKANYKEVTELYDEVKAKLEKMREG